MLYGLILAYTNNLGDDIQSLAAKQFLPRVDVILDRDSLNKYEYTEEIKVIMNGWFTHKPKNWPPSSCISPLFISFHITPKAAEKLLRHESVSYLKKHEPIGCRDFYTKTLLENKGLEAYFSGCLTLTLDYKYKSKKKGEKILLVDVDKEIVDRIKRLPQISGKTEIITHRYSPPPFSRYGLKRLKNLLPENMRNLLWENIAINMILKKGKKIPVEERFKRAEEQLQRLATAKLVLTSRLHAALPAVALGTNVIFIHNNLKDPRFLGLLDYVNHYHISEFKKIINKFDFDNPPENPNRDRLEKLKKQMIYKIRKFLEE